MLLMIRCRMLPRRCGILAFVFCAVWPLSGVASASIISTGGAVVLTTTPHPSASDTEIFAFDEQQSVMFVGAQTLDFGSIAAGTLVNSHYLQYNPVTPTGSVGFGTVTFDGVILGVITSTANLTSSLSPAASGTSDTYFGLESTLGAYPAGAPGTEQFRGLGSPLDVLTINLGTHTFIINGLDIETPGALDGIRVLTAVPAVPEPHGIFLACLGVFGVLATRNRREGTDRLPRS